MVQSKGFDDEGDEEPETGEERRFPEIPKPVEDMLGGLAKVMGISLKEVEPMHVHLDPISTLIGKPGEGAKLGDALGAAQTLQLTGQIPMLLGFWEQVFTKHLMKCPSKGLVYTLMHKDMEALAVRAKDLAEKTQSFLDDVDKLMIEQSHKASECPGGCEGDITKSAFEGENGKASFGSKDE